MAVYTPLTHEEVAQFLTHYTLGELVSVQGIVEGVSNSNYLLTTHHLSRTTRYILTIFEQRTETSELPYFMALTTWLADRGIACPRPLRGIDGGSIYNLKGKKAVLVEFLEGKNNPEITPVLCAQLGELTAKMHLAAEGFSMVRRNAMGREQWHVFFAHNRAKLATINPDMERLICDELAYLDKHWPASLPSGVIHADLFPDNVFFCDERLSGVIDFYFACHDFWAYDLMIAINAWCFDSQHQFVPARAQAMVDGYQKIRTLTQAEKDAMPILARGAAMRFLSTRCHDWLHRNPSAIVVAKDPLEYVAKLRFWQLG